MPTSPAAAGPPSDAIELERRTRELHALTEVAKTLTAALDLPDLLDAGLAKISRVLDPAEAGAIMLWDQPAGLFRAEAAFGYDLAILRELGLRAGESITGKAFDAGAGQLLGTPEAVAQAMADMRPANRATLRRALGAGRPANPLPYSALAVPLRAGEHRFGVLTLESFRDDAPFSEHDLALTQVLADLIALAIDRARLQAKADAVRAAQQADRLRAEIMATLSHELRTPLGVIKGYATALLLEDAGWPEDRRREFLQLIDDETDNLQVMVSDILDSALIDAGQLGVEPEPVRLPLLAREVAEEMQRHTEAHQLVTDFPRDFPLVEADPRRITQVMRNILDNAIKYSPGGGLVVVRGEARPADVVISIADQGVGIAPEDLIPLFEKYFRVKAPTGYHVPGTGLGLPVARALVEAHGGRIWAESKLGQGTTLYFSLPRADLGAE